MEAEPGPLTTRTRAPLPGRASLVHHEPTREAAFYGHAEETDPNPL
jgi:hypothetical protein